MKLMFATVLLMLTFKMGWAQSPYFSYQGKDDLSGFLGKKIRPMPILIESCLMPFTYVKFKITKENTVDSLIITNNSIKDVTNEIVRVMTLTNGNWNVEQTKNKWFIVPIIFYTEFNKNSKPKGCDFRKILADQNKEMSFENKEPNAVYLPLVMIQSSLML